MSVLVLRLAGPLQSWGEFSRFVRRTTELMPTKSGIIGLLAASSGRRRSDPIEDLVGLRLAVRADQPGELLRDFHTAHHAISGKSMPLSNRYYLSDAVFVAAIEGPQGLVEGLAESLADPAFPLYLGRRSCVPEGRMVLGVEHDSTAESVMRNTPWQATPRQRRRHRQERVRLSVQADVGVFDGIAPIRQIRDLPLSFSPEMREYAMRDVVEVGVEVTNPDHVDAPVAMADHDPIAAAKEAR